MADNALELSIDVDVSRANSAIGNFNDKLDDAIGTVQRVDGAITGFSDSVKSHIETLKSLAEIASMAWGIYRIEASRAATVAAEAAQNAAYNSAMNAARTTAEYTGLKMITGETTAAVGAQRLLAGATAEAGVASAGAGISMVALVRAMASVAGTASVMAFKAIAAELFAVADGMAKVVMATAELGAKDNFLVDTIDRLRMVSKDTGVELGTLMKAVDKVFAPGDKRAISDLGVETRNLWGENKKSLEVFQEVVTAIGKIEDPSKRAIAQYKIFGDVLGHELMPLMNEFTATAVANSRAADVMANSDRIALTTLTDDLRPAREFLKSFKEEWARTTIWELLFPPLTILRDSDTAWTKFVDGAALQLARLNKYLKDSEATFNEFMSSRTQWWPKTSGMFDLAPAEEDLLAKAGIVTGAREKSNDQYMQGNANLVMRNLAESNTAPGLNKFAEAQAQSGAGKDAAFVAQAAIAKTTFGVQKELAELGKSRDTYFEMLNAITRGAGPTKAFTPADLDAMAASKDKKEKILEATRGLSLASPEASAALGAEIAGITQRMLAIENSIEIRRKQVNEERSASKEVLASTAALTAAKRDQAKSWGADALAIVTSTVSESEAAKRSLDVLYFSMKEHAAGIAAIRAQEKTEIADKSSFVDKDNNLVHFNLSPAALSSIHESTALKIAAFDLKFNEEESRRTEKMWDAMIVRMRKNMELYSIAPAHKDLEVWQKSTDLDTQRSNNALASSKTVIDDSKNAQLAQNASIYAVTLQSKIDLEYAKTAIETQALRDRTQIELQQIDVRTKADIRAAENAMQEKGIFDEARLSEITRRITAIAQDEKDALTRHASNEVATMQVKGATQASHTIISEYTRVFDSLKQQSGGVFDALLYRSGSVFGAIANSLKNILLTAIKDIMTSRVAVMLTNLFVPDAKAHMVQSGIGGTGAMGSLGALLGIGSKVAFGQEGKIDPMLQPINDNSLLTFQNTQATKQLTAVISSGITYPSAEGGTGQFTTSDGFNFPGFSGSGESAAASRSGGLTGLLGLGSRSSMSGFGMGGFPVTGIGTLGATPPFMSGGAGVPGSAGGMGSIGSLAGMAGILPKLGSLFGVGGSVSTGAGAATTWGAATLGQQAGSVLSSTGAALGGGALAFDGLKRGGWLGLGEDVAGGALIGAKFGGPLGAAIGAGIGALAGTIRLFMKSATEKLKSKIKDVYQIDIDDKDFLQSILDLAKSSYGGNLDVCIRSAQVRDWLMYYRMQTNQASTGNLGAIDNSARGVSLSGYGGGVTQNSVYVGGAGYNYGGLIGATTPGNTFQPQPTTIQANLYIDGRQVNASVQQANTGSSGRRESAALLRDPLLTYG